MWARPRAMAPKPQTRTRGLSCPASQNPRLRAREKNRAVEPMTAQVKGDMPISTRGSDRPHLPGPGCQVLQQVEDHMKQYHAAQGRPGQVDWKAVFDQKHQGRGSQKTEDGPPKGFPFRALKYSRVLAIPGVESAAGMLFFRKACCC